MQCTQCGGDLRLGQEQVGVNAQNIPIFHNFGYCDKCYFKYDLDVPNSQAQNAKEFPGIYRYTFFGKKEEVYCPRCGSWDCSHHQEQKIIPGKTKTRYTANLNPLRPFTFVNKKEKVVRKEEVISISKFMCNKCGYIFE